MICFESRLLSLYERKKSVLSFTKESFNNFHFALNYPFKQKSHSFMAGSDDTVFLSVMIVTVSDSRRVVDKKHVFAESSLAVVVRNRAL